MVFIKGTRSGYAPDSCDKTVTVGELIDILREYDSDAPVYLCNENGYTYGHINENTIWDSEDE